MFSTQLKSLHFLPIVVGGLLVNSVVGLSLVAGQFFPRAWFDGVIHSANALMLLLLAWMLTSLSVCCPLKLRTYAIIGFGFVAGIELVSSLQGILLIQPEDQMIALRKQYVVHLPSLAVLALALLWVVSRWRDTAPVVTTYRYLLGLGLATAGLYGAGGLLDVDVISSAAFLFPYLGIMLLWLMVIARSWQQHVEHPFFEALLGMSIPLFLASGSMALSIVCIGSAWLVILANFLTVSAYVQLILMLIRLVSREYKHQQNQAQAWLAENEQLQHAMTALSDQVYAMNEHAIIAITDPQGRIEHVNDMFCNISGYAREELLGQNHRLINSGMHSPQFFQQMYQALWAGKVWQGELCNRAKDGHLYWVSTTITPIMNAQGKPQQFIAIRTDISKLKAMEEEVSAQRAFYERISETLGEGLYVQDAEGRCQYMNKEAETLLGWPREEFIGKPVHETIHYQTAAGEPLASEKCPILQSQRHGKVSIDNQVFINRQGKALPVSVVSQSIYQGDKYQGAVVVFKDITERIKAEAELAEYREHLEYLVSQRTSELQIAKDAAETANRAKSDFLAAMSHEIRTPMNGVIGMLDVLMQTALDDKQLKMAHTIRESAETQLEILNEILDFSKIEAGKLELSIEPFSLQALAENIYPVLDQFALNKGVDLKLYVDPKLPNSLVGDDLRLRQVLFNLINNAIKFSSATDCNGQVSVAIKPIRQQAQRLWIEFTIQDNGIGMDVATQNRLFKAFTQADSSTSKRYGGTGLGLVISHRLIEMMGGEIRLSSVVNEGSIFTVTLPFTVAEALLQPSASELQGLACIVIGNDPELMPQLTAHLVHAGCVLRRVASDVAMDGNVFSAAALCVWLLDFKEGLPVDVLQGAPSAYAQNQQHLFVLKHLSVGPGQKRKPQRIATHIVQMDGNLLTQRNVKHALLLATGQPVSGLSVAAEVRSIDIKRALCIDKLILVAEDNEINQDVIRQQLRLLGYHADIVSDGRAALERWQNHDYALLITDVHMPNMDGYQLTQAIRTIERQQAKHPMPIVALTAVALKGEAKHCQAAGMNDYLSKPITLSVLQVMLAKWLTVGEHSADLSLDPLLLSAPLLVQDTPVLDVKMLDKLIGNNPGLQQQLLTKFLRRAEQQMTEIRQAAASNNLPQIAKITHALKSSARTVGGAQLGELCHGIEMAVNNQDEVNCNILLERLYAVYAETTQAISHFLSVTAEQA